MKQTKESTKESEKNFIYPYVVKLTDEEKELQPSTAQDVILEHNRIIQKLVRIGKETTKAETAGEGEGENDSEGDGEEHKKESLKKLCCND